MAYYCHDLRNPWSRAKILEFYWLMVALCIVYDAVTVMQERWWNVRFEFVEELDFVVYKLCVFESSSLNNIVVPLRKTILLAVNTLSFIFSWLERCFLVYHLWFGQWRHFVSIHGRCVDKSSKQLLLFNVSI